MTLTPLIVSVLAKKIILKTIKGAATTTQPECQNRVLEPSLKKSSGDTNKIWMNVMPCFSSARKERSFGGANWPKLKPITAPDSAAARGIIDAIKVSVMVPYSKGLMLKLDQ